MKNEILKDYCKKIEELEESENYLTALILAHNFLEYFMRESIKVKISLMNKDRDFNKINDLHKKIDKTKYFEKILDLFELFLVPNKSLSDDLRDLNSYRNKLSHKLIFEEISGKTFKNQIKKRCFQAKSLCIKLDSMLIELIFELWGPEISKQLNSYLETLRNVSTIPSQIKESIKELEKGFPSLPNKISKILKEINKEQNKK